MKKAPLKPKKERTSVRLPKTAQQSIPIRRIYRDGIWEVDGKFSRCWRFTDINYAVSDEEDKKDTLIKYCALEKGLPTDAITKISIVNKHLNPLEFQKEMLLPSRQDGRDDYRREYTRMLLDKAAEGNGIVQDRYITVSVERRSIEEARSFFARVGSDLANNMKKLGSQLFEQDNSDRLRVLHDFFRIGDDSPSMAADTDEVVDASFGEPAPAGTGTARRRGSGLASRISEQSEALLQEAARHAAEFGRAEVDTEHLLLALSEPHSGTESRRSTETRTAQRNSKSGACGGNRHHPLAEQAEPEQQFFRHSAHAAHRCPRYHALHAG